MDQTKEQHHLPTSYMVKVLGISIVAKNINYTDCSLTQKLSNHRGAL